MSKEEPKVFSRELKLIAVRRLEACENVAALGQELGVARQLIYTWRKRFLSGGAEALQGKGRPHTVPLGSVVVAPASTQARVLELELERTIGRQQVDLDFFQRALRHIEGRRQPSVGPGATASTKSSGR
jgi:transposase